MSLKGTKTEDNLRAAFARKSQANRRHLFFAQQAEIEGQPDVAIVFKSVADAETGHAFGHLEYLASLGSGDPMTDSDIGETTDNLAAAIAAKTTEVADLYPAFAKQARAEGFAEIADWFDSIARADQTHLLRLQQALAVGPSSQ
jgi:rubrerythrin